MASEKLNQLIKNIEKELSATDRDKTDLLKYDEFCEKIEAIDRLRLKSLAKAHSKLFV